MGLVGGRSGGVCAGGRAGRRPALPSRHPGPPAGTPLNSVTSEKAEGVTSESWKGDFFQGQSLFSVSPVTVLPRAGVSLQDRITRGGNRATFTSSMFSRLEGGGSWRWSTCTPATLCGPEGPRA